MNQDKNVSLVPPTLKGNKQKGAKEKEEKEGKKAGFDSVCTNPLLHYTRLGLKQKLRPRPNPMKPYVNLAVLSLVPVHNYECPMKKTKNIYTRSPS